MVLLEDFGALAGLLFAFICVLIADLTNNPIWDGVGTLSIGILLGFIAIVLAVETKSLLIGEVALPEQRAKIESAILSSSHVKRLLHIRTEYLGPETLLVAAKVQFSNDLSSVDISKTINAIEKEIRTVEPVAQIIYIEPDIFDTNE